MAGVAESAAASLRGGICRFEVPPVFVVSIQYQSVGDPEPYKPNSCLGRAIKAVVDTPDSFDILQCGFVSRRFGRCRFSDWDLTTRFARTVDGVVLRFQPRRLIANSLHLSIQSASSWSAAWVAMKDGSRDVVHQAFCIDVAREPRFDRCLWKRARMVGPEIYLAYDPFENRLVCAVLRCRRRRFSGKYRR